MIVFVYPSLSTLPTHVGQGSFLHCGVNKLDFLSTNPQPKASSPAPAHWQGRANPFEVHGRCARPLLEDR